MGAGHAIALAVDSGWTLLLDEALKGKIEDLAGELAGKGKTNLYLARGEKERDVDDAEGLGDESEVCANEGELIVGILQQAGG